MIVNSLTKAERQIQHASASARGSSSFLHRRLLAMLSNIQFGTLSVHDGEGRRDLLIGKEDDIAAQITIYRPYRMLSAVLRKGAIGFGESYMAGDWGSENLANLLELLLKNKSAMEQEFLGSSLGRVFAKWRHGRNKNTVTNSRKNISYHYDMGNDFYSLWLDKSMTYSSALYTQETKSLEQAQHAKYMALLESLGANSPANILEIGCGWGGFAEVAGREGHSLVGLTLSDQQKAYAEQRLLLAGLDQRCTIRLQDYRKERGRYDHVVSIEMLEAVGTEYWEQYFEQVYRCLKPGGRAAIQVIVMGEAHYEAYDRGTDFIQQYIFPGGKLPTVTHLRELSSDAGFKVVGHQRFGMDYKDTLMAWRLNFEARLSEVRSLGYDERFIRMWRYYLAYCEAGFVHDRIDVVHWVIEKPSHEA